MRGIGHLRPSVRAKKQDRPYTSHAMERMAEKIHCQSDMFGAYWSDRGLLL